MSIDHEMVRVARIIAADQNLTVHVRGSKAFAVKGAITIPNIENYDWLGARYAKRMLHGLVDHECGHASDTDFDAMSAWQASTKPCQALFHIWNAIEDGYIERRQGERYKGCRTNIRLMNEWFLGEKDDDGKTPIDRVRDGDDMVTGVLQAIIPVLADHGGRTVDFYEDLNADVGAMLRLCEPEILEAQAMAGTHQTAANIELAKRIFDKLNAAATDEEKKKIATMEIDAPTVDALSVLERWTKAAPMCATEGINARIDSVFEQPDATRPYTIFAPEFDVERDFSAEDQGELSEAYSAAEDDAAEVSDALVFAFEHALRSTAMIVPVSGHDEGEIDSNLIAEYAVGAVSSDRLYIQPEEGESDETAVYILADCSGSMAGHKARLCRHACIAMHRALRACMIAHEIGGFTTLEERDIPRHPWAHDKIEEHTRSFARMRQALEEAQAHGVVVENFARAVYGHYETLDEGADLMVPVHAIFKGWGSNDPRSLMKIEGLDQNLDGEAVMWAAHRLAKRHERRKVMFVVSDGYPAGSRDNAQGHTYLKDSIARIIDAGIEVYGIGIASDAVEEFYPIWWRADNADDLISIAMGGMTEVLTANRKERARIFM